MKVVPYNELMRAVCDAMGWDPAAMDAREFQVVRRAVSRALREVWETCFWPEITRTERRKFHPAYNAAETVTVGTWRYFPATDAYYCCLQEGTGNAPAELVGGVWQTNLEFWHLGQRVLTAGDWDSGTVYAQGDLVYYATEDAYFQLHTVGVAGTLPSDGHYWGEVEALDPVIPWTMTGTLPIGEVEGVYVRDPGVHRGEESVAWDETANGIQVREPELNSPWVRYRLRVPRLVGEVWASGTAYTAVNGEEAVTA